MDTALLKLPPVGPDDQYFLIPQGRSKPAAQGQRVPIHSSFVFASSATSIDIEPFYPEDYWASLIAACAAARRAIGTR